MSAWAVILALPLAGLALGRALQARQVSLPPIQAAALIGLVSPPVVVAWRGRSFPEQVCACLVSLVAWAGPTLRGDWSLYVAFGLIGATWAAILGLDDLRTSEGSVTPTPPPAPTRGSLPPRPADASEYDVAELGFKLALRCPSCGAQLAVPAYHRMARCGFCDSDHVVTGGGGPVVAVIPDAVPDQAALVQAVARHFAHQRYLELYDRRVRPLVQHAEATQRDGDAGIIFAESRPNPIAEAMEREVALEAEAYGRRAAERLVVRSWRRFLSPYWHRFGTLYQAAFGRDESGEKRMEFLVATLEGSVSASSAALPEMGKLSYLKALRPLAGAPEASSPALAVDVPVEAIDARVQDPSARRTGFGIRPIAVRGTFVPEVIALVYRPWHAVEVELDGSPTAFLVDGGAASVAGAPPAADPPVAAPELTPGSTIALAPSRCPECAGPLPYAPDAVVHLCRTCLRAVLLDGRRWRTLVYAHEPIAPGTTLVPFWRFPLRLRAADGELITDIPHLTDGIDGAFDQIGDTPQRQQEFYVPAFRTRVSKAGVRFYRTLWPVLQGRPRRLERERFTPDRPPADLVEVTLPADEARVFARVYLALAFSSRDLARAEVKRVRARFLEAELEGEPELTLLALPTGMIAGVRDLLGRARPTALAAIEGRPHPPGA